MAVRNFSASQTVATFNIAPITDWGSSDPAFTLALVEDAVTMTQGNGGNAVAFGRKNPIYELVVNLSPGGPNSSLVWSAFQNELTVTFTYEIIQTLEKFIGTEGRVINIGTTGRAGPTISDDTYTIQFNNVTMFKGGNAI